MFRGFSVKPEERADDRPNDGPILLRFHQNVVSSSDFIFSVWSARPNANDIRLSGESEWRAPRIQRPWRSLKPWARGQENYVTRILSANVLTFQNFKRVSPRDRRKCPVGIPV